MDNRTPTKPVAHDQRGQFKGELTAEAVTRRQYLAYKMRLAGTSFDEIGTALSTSRMTAYRDVAAAHAAYAAEATEDLEDMRRLAAARLDQALFAVMPAVKKGDAGAVKAMLAIERRRADLLGLDAPRRVELTGKDGGPVQSEGLVGIRERLTPEEAGDVADALLRRLAVARQETLRLSAPGKTLAGREQQDEKENENGF